MFIIQINDQECWVADYGFGDPPRTVVRENAQVFRTEAAAQKRITQVKKTHRPDTVDYKILPAVCLDKRYIRSIRAAIADKGLNEQKESLVHQYTNKRTTHISEMTTHEALQLLAKLNEGQVKTEDTRKKMIRLCYSIGYQLKLTDDAGELDKARFDGLIKRLSPQHKSIQEHNYDEMVTLCSIMRKYLREQPENVSDHAEVQT